MRAQRAANRYRLGIAALAALTLVGCGPRSDQAGEPNAAGIVSIKVAGADASSSATPLFVAMRRGFFKEAGLNVTYVSLSGATAMAAAMKAGEIDVGIGGATQWISDTARGAIHGKLIGELTDNNYVIIGRDGLDDVRQLKGKIFAISSRNAGDHLYSQTVLSHFGIGPEDITWLSMGEPGARLSALRAGKVDATEMTLTSVPPGERSHVLINIDDSPVPFVSNAIYARQPLLDANKGALTKFLAALGKAADWIRAHPAEAMPACQESGLSAPACKTAIDIALASKNPFTWSSNTQINAKGIATMLPIIASVVPQVKTLKIRDIVDTSVAPKMR